MTKSNKPKIDKVSTRFAQQPKASLKYKVSKISTSKKSENSYRLIDKTLNFYHHHLSQQPNRTEITQAIIIS